MMLYLRMSACWLEHTRLQMIERVRELRCQSFRSSPRRPPKSEERKGRKKCAQKWAPSPIHASRVTTRKARKEIQSKTFRVAHFRVAVHSHAFASVSFAPSLFHRAKPFTAAKKKTVWDASFYAKKKSESNAKTTAYHARPPLALSFG